MASTQSRKMKQKNHQAILPGSCIRRALSASPIVDELLCAGPGFSLTFSLGNCTFDDKAILSKDGALQCFGPSVALQKTPLTFTSAYKQAATFTGQVRGDLAVPQPPQHSLSMTSLLVSNSEVEGASSHNIIRVSIANFTGILLTQECKVGKSFGQPKSKILYVFDPKKMQNDSSPVSGLATYLEKQLGELLPMLGIQSISVSAAHHLHSAAAGLPGFLRYCHMTS